jgi:imidazolonepropionase-like amidohydrolase
MKVAAHAHGTKAIENATLLGVDSIEHGTFGTADTDKAMKDGKTYLVPTLIAGQTVFDYAKMHPEALGPSSAAKALAVAPQMASNMMRAYRAGVKIAFGTDAGVYAHGQNAREFALMVKAGMPAIDAILSATSGAAALIGDDADIGSIRTGRYADIIAVNGDPTMDVTLLQHVIFVMKSGRVVKSD